MNYNSDSLKENLTLVHAFLKAMSTKNISKLIGITPTTSRKYLRNSQLLYRAPYRITNKLIIEAIKYNNFINSRVKDDFVDFSKKAIIIGNHNNNLLSARILLSEKYLIDNRLVLKQIADKTNIPYSSLKSYQSKRIDLEDASWSRILVLSQYKKAIDLSNIISNSIIEKMLKANDEKL